MSSQLFHYFISAAAVPTARAFSDDTVVMASRRKCVTDCVQNHD